jgi:hypothetical protein
MTVISYPIPPYANVPIAPQYYQPSRFVISAITLGITTTITTTEDLDYVIGQLVRLIIPPSYGTRQLNEQQGYVIAIPAANQVTLDINSQSFDPFVNSSATTKAQILAIGDINTGYQSSTGRSIPTINGNTQIAIPGSFINTSPF